MKRQASSSNEQAPTRKRAFCPPLVNKACNHQANDIVRDSVPQPVNRGSALPGPVRLSFRSPGQRTDNLPISASKSSTYVSTSGNAPSSPGQGNAIACGIVNPDESAGSGCRGTTGCDGSMARPPVASHAAKTGPTGRMPPSESKAPNVQASYKTSGLRRPTLVPKLNQNATSTPSAPRPSCSNSVQQLSAAAASQAAAAICVRASGAPPRAAHQLPTVSAPAADTGNPNATTGRSVLHTGDVPTSADTAQPTPAEKVETAAARRIRASPSPGSASTSATTFACDPNRDAAPSGNPEGQTASSEPPKGLGTTAQSGANSAAKGPHLSPSPAPSLLSDRDVSPEAVPPLNLSVFLEQVSAVAWPDPPPQPRSQSQEGRTAAPSADGVDMSVAVQRLRTVLLQPQERQPLKEMAPFSQLIGALQIPRLLVALPQPAPKQLNLASSGAARIVQSQLLPRPVASTTSTCASGSVVKQHGEDNSSRVFPGPLIGRRATGGSVVGRLRCLAPYGLVRAMHRAQRDTLLSFSRQNQQAPKRIDATTGLAIECRGDIAHPSADVTTSASCGPAGNAGGSGGGERLAPPASSTELRGVRVLQCGRDTHMRRAAGLGGASGPTPGVSPLPTVTTAETGAPDVKSSICIAMTGTMMEEDISARQIGWSGLSMDFLEDIFA